MGWGWPGGRSGAREEGRHAADATLLHTRALIHHTPDLHTPITTHRPTSPLAPQSSILLKGSLAGPASSPCPPPPHTHTPPSPLKVVPLRLKGAHVQRATIPPVLQHLLDVLPPLSLPAAAAAAAGVATHRQPPRSSATWGRAAGVGGGGGGGGGQPCPQPARAAGLGKSRGKGGEAQHSAAGPAAAPVGALHWVKDERVVFHAAGRLARRVCGEPAACSGRGGRLLATGAGLEAPGQGALDGAAPAPAPLPPPGLWPRLFMQRLN